MQFVELWVGPSAQPHTSFYPWSWLRQNSYDPPLARDTPPEYVAPPFDGCSSDMPEQEDLVGFENPAGSTYSDVRGGNGGGRAGAVQMALKCRASSFFSETLAAA